MKIVIFCVILTFAVSVFALDETKAKCGYDSCPKLDPKKINVHLIPHSHDDVGWVKTVDQYYNDQVKDIITGVLHQELQKNPDRRFIQVETAFFWKWWQ